MWVFSFVIMEIRMCGWVWKREPQAYMYADGRTIEIVHRKVIVCVPDTRYIAYEFIKINSSVFIHLDAVGVCFIRSFSRLTRFASIQLEFSIKNMHRFSTSRLSFLWRLWFCFGRGFFFTQLLVFPIWHLSMFDVPEAKTKIEFDRNVESVSELFPKLIFHIRQA